MTGQALAIIGLVTGIAGLVWLSAFVAAGRRADDFHASLARRLDGRSAPELADEPAGDWPSMPSDFPHSDRDSR